MFRLFVNLEAGITLYSCVIALAPTGGDLKVLSVCGETYSPPLNLGRTKHVSVIVIVNVEKHTLTLSKLNISVESCEIVRIYAMFSYNNPDGRLLRPKGFVSALARTLGLRPFSSAVERQVATPREN